MLAVLEGLEVVGDGEGVDEDAEGGDCGEAGYEGVASSEEGGGCCGGEMGWWWWGGGGGRGRGRGRGWGGGEDVEGFDAGGEDEEEGSRGFGNVENGVFF